MEETISSKRIYEGRVLKLRVDEVRLPSGRTSSREIIEHPGAVAIIAIDPEGRLVLVRQYRKAPNEELLEVPAGTREPNEGPVDCVRRELQEETGYLAATIKALGRFYSAPGFCTEVIETYLATDLEEKWIEGPPDEDTTVVTLSLPAALELIRSGEIRDGKTIAGLLLYQLRRDSEQLP